MIPRYFGTFRWTQHSKAKMRFYHLSESRVKRILYSPTRVEEGIAPETVAFMQSVSNRKHPYEIWVMVQERDAKSTLSFRRLPRGTMQTNDANTKKDLRMNLEKSLSANRRRQSEVTIISAWRYPGVTKPGDPLPVEILDEIDQIV